MQRDEGEPRDSDGKFTYRIGASERVSDGVLAAVSAVSDRTGGPATADGIAGPRVLRPLYEVIDPDALDALFGPTASGDCRNGGTVTFRYDGCEVTVGDDLVRVRPSGGDGVFDDR